MGPPPLVVGETTRAGATRPGLGPDDVLLDVKLSVPEPRRGLVSRAALADAARDGGTAAVGVTAPAGYGKSTLLVEWAHRDPRRVGWISLDRYDDDPSTLLLLLASAFERAMPEQAGLAAALRGLDAAAFGRGAAHVGSAFRQAPAPFILLLDDLHELRSPACHDVLDVVLSSIPPGSQVVTASRHDQPHLPRLRAAGDAVELTAPDLALDATAAEHIFTTADVGITPARALDVTERTEGWPVGLHLAALIARDGGDTAWGVTGDDRYVADYLHREVYRRLDPSIQRFLRRTAVLDRLHGPLCDAVLEDPEAQGRLRTLDASNAFLVPLDRRREWYRHHSLFREFLLGELLRDEPGLIEQLQVRAADWFQSHGAPAVAVEYLLATDERDRCARLVADLALTTYGEGRVSTLQRWIRALGDAAIEAYPPLAVLAGWVAASVGHTADAQRWAAVADEATFDPTPTHGGAAFASSRSLLRAMMCAAGPAQMMADAEFAASLEPPWSPWRATALCVLGEAHLVAGEPAPAVSVLEDATAVGLAAGDTVPVVLSESGLALIDMDGGRWDEAAEHVARALSIVDRHALEEYAISLLPFAAAARLAVHQGDLVEADRQVTRAMRARTAATFVLPCLATRGRLELAKVCWTRGDHASARHLLGEIDGLLRLRPELGMLVEEASKFRAMTTPATATAIPRAAPLTPAELRLLPHLQTHLRIGDIAQRLHVSRNTVASEVSAIYRKLGVRSRGEAVQQATLLGLLGG
ncbi:helix-turn-helix transcriptional regulator [Nocardioides dongkuii]|uniref:helix-turn-helix transcriptional regulator n=1 Tax=Nocardioides dongkuii TaxID=2760089 RepID=UPI0029D41557|nr:LuxR C-terminal-related transcriptional regulator [Nocardioides dongkuii]